MDAVGIVSGVAKAHDVILATHNGQLVCANARKGLEGGSGRAAAVRTMAVERIFEGVGHLIAHSTTKAFAAKAIRSPSHSAASMFKKAMED